MEGINLVELVNLNNKLLFFYKVVVNNSLSAYSSQCTVNIQNAHQKAQVLMASLEGRQKLQSLFK